MNGAALAVLRQRLSQQGWIDVPATGQSMHPLIKAGDVCRFIPASVDRLRRGDIVLFTSGQRLVGHRLHRIESRRGTPVLICKGDANLNPDPPIEWNQVIAVMASIQKRRLRIRSRGILAKTWAWYMLVIAGYTRRGRERFGSMAGLVGGLWRPLRRLLPYVFRFWRGYVGLTAFMVIEVAMGLFAAWYLKNMTEAAASHQLHRVFHLVALGLAACVLNGVFVFNHSYLKSSVVSRLIWLLKTELFDHILRFGAGTMDRYPSGDLMSRLTSDVEDIGRIAGNTLLDLLRLPLTSACSFIYLMHLNTQLSFVFLLFVPFAGVVSLASSRLTRLYSARYYEWIGKLQTFLQDSLAGHATVRAFQLERVLSARYREETLGLWRVQMASAKLQAGMKTGASISGFILFLFSISLGAVYLAQGQLSVGSLLAFVALTQQLVQPLLGLAGQFGGLQRSMGAANRVWRVLDEPLEQTSLAVASQIRSSRPIQTLELRSVSFSYDGVTNVLEDMTLTLHSGSVVALVGPSGAGKSTLFKLLMRFYQPASGDILLDNRPMRDLSEQQVRRCFGYVGQETFLFSAAIRENLLYGMPNASELQLIHAAKAANAHDFIMSLPDGYETHIGDFGSRLSGGQRQRLAIARAMLRDAPILLLDEATSALDATTEQQVRQALSRLMSGRMTLVIAHQLPTVQMADSIVVLDRGRIVAQGRHADLIEDCTLYAGFYQSVIFQSQDKSSQSKHTTVHF